MKYLTLVVIALLSFCVVVALPPQAFSQQATQDLTWAYPVPDKNPPPAGDAKELKHLPGSTQSFTQAQIDDQLNPPDWYPQEHAPLPDIVQHGFQVQACGSCHLMSGHGHPESATLAGLPVEYMMRQMSDFKSGARKDPMAYGPSGRAARMNAIAKGLPEEDMRQAVAFFAALKPAVWYKVEEARTVPKTWVNGGRMRLPLPGGGTESLGNRIVTLPQDPARVESRDPHSGFIAYVPPGSLKKGETLVKTGGSGKTIACEICHGEGLKGLGDVPRLAGIHPIYIVRQLYNFQIGANSSTAGAQMKKVAEKLTEDDMIAIAAYAASLAP